MAIILISIVEIVAYLEYENYPNPMSYRLDTIFLYTFISFYGILTAYKLSNGKNLNEISILKIKFLFELLFIKKKSFINF